jgi:hypothetical protein
MDIRLPLGIMFCIYGILLAGTGILGREALRDRSLGININLLWGLVLLAVGGVMLLLGWFGVRRSSRAKQIR